jgi:DNA adenine methylase
MRGGDWLSCPTVIPYIGGKYQFSRTLLPMCPEHNRYVEVFAGGLSMFFRKKSAKRSIVNDVDRNLINLYICILEKNKEFRERLFWYPKSRDLHKIINKSFDKTLLDFDIPNGKRAADYFYLIRNTFNKTLANNTLSSDSYWNTDIWNELMYSRNKLNNTLIDNLDFEALIEKHEPQEGDFWYLDPPYIVADTRKYYTFNFTYEDHVRLKENIDIIHNKGGKFMISYDDKEDIYNLYNKYNIHSIPVQYSTNRAKGTQDKMYNELVITNYKVLKQESLF